MQVKEAATWNYSVPATMGVAMKATWKKFVPEAASPKPKANVLPPASLNTGSEACQVPLGLSQRPASIAPPEWKPAGWNLSQGVESPSIVGDGGNLYDYRDMLENTDPIMEFDTEGWPMAMTVRAGRTNMPFAPFHLSMNSHASGQYV